MSTEPAAAPDGHDDATDAAAQRLHGDLMVEYARLSDLVSAFDQRLLTIKGWGVTLSLASLGLAFQQRHYGLFLVAALSGFAFWIVEALTKRHQMRLYPRMRDIEVASFRHFSVVLDGERLSSPLIDWGWKSAPGRYGERVAVDPAVPEPYHPPGPVTPVRGWWRTARPLWLLHVAMPHAVAVVAGLVLFFLGAAGRLDDMPL